MNLQTSYMGLPLKNPLMVSSCPLSENLDCLRRMEDAGAAGIVLFSLFEEQLRHDDEEMAHYLSVGAEAHGGAPSYFPALNQYRAAPDEYLDHLQCAVDGADIPIVASINGVTNSGWISHATRMEEAGAAAIELNIYTVPSDPGRSGRDVEADYLEVLRAVKRAVHIPVALKLNPYFSSLAHMACQCEEAGADGLVLFNRFLQPDIDPERGEIVPVMELSRPSELRLPMMWIALLRSQIGCSLAGSTGVHGVDDMVKYLMAGADIAMVSSAVLANGIPFIEALLEDLATWLDRHGYERIDQIRGCMAQHAVADPSAFQRANYIKALQAYDDQGCE